MNNGKTEVAKDFKGAIKKLVDYNKNMMGLIIVSLILAFIASVLSIIGPDKLKDITNIISAGIMTGIDLSKVHDIAISLVIIYVIGAIFGYIQGFIMNTITAIFQKKMRNDISKKINKLPLSYFDKTTVGDILSRVTNDVDTIGFTMTQSLSSIVGSTTLLIGSVFMMFYTNWILAITAILSTIIGMIFVVVIVIKSQKYFNEVQKSLGDINGHIEEVFSGHNVVKAYNAEEEMNNKFDKINEHLFDCYASINGLYW